MAADTLGLVVEHVADRVPVDWASVEGRLSSALDRAQLEGLRILDALAGACAALPVVSGVLPASPASAPPVEAVSWGRYRIRKEVGSGSYGRVFHAHDPELDMEVAIKVLHRHVGDADLRARLVREGRALARVRNDHVVRVLGLESFEEQLGLCMEFVHGDTLDAVVRAHGTLTPDEARLVGRDVCQALASVHREGFLHRDVKARNVMRDRMGRIVLMDFGTGISVDDADRVDARFTAGTPMYMAPEVLAGQAPSVAADIYSVGVLLYYLVTGAYPVEGRSLPELSAAHMTGRQVALRERRPSAPSGFAAVVERALARKPEDRWPSTAALLDALDRGQEDPWWTIVARRAAIAVAWVGGIGGGVIAVGAITSKYFNTFVLGRAGFVHESMWDWFRFGAMSFTAPLVLCLLIILGWSVTLAVLRAAARNVPTAARAMDTGRRFGARLGFDDVSSLSAWALVAAAAFLGVVWWSQLPMLEWIMGLMNGHQLSEGPAASLAFLGPGGFTAREDYRVWFTWSTLIALVVWLPVLRLSKTHSVPVNRLMLLGGAGVFTLSLLLMALPFRAFSQRDLETATWQGQSCFVLGEREQDVLVFCPERVPPRSVTVPRSSSDLQRHGLPRDVFERIDQAK
ncbi:MAG: serine/threonine-protein kinase [Vicinamibacterales bacterium]